MNRLMLSPLFQPQFSGYFPTLHIHLLRDQYDAEATFTVGYPGKTFKETETTAPNPRLSRCSPQ
jgi:hypothetical protein